MDAIIYQVYLCGFWENRKLLNTQDVFVIMGESTVLIITMHLLFV